MKIRNLACLTLFVLLITLGGFYTASAAKIDHYSEDFNNITAGDYNVTSFAAATGWDIVGFNGENGDKISVLYADATRANVLKLIGGYNSAANDGKGLGSNVTYSMNLSPTYTAENDKLYIEFDFKASQAFDNPQMLTIFTNDGIPLYQMMITSNTQGVLGIAHSDATGQLTLTNSGLWLQNYNNVWINTKIILDFETRTSSTTFKGQYSSPDNALTQNLRFMPNTLQSTGVGKIVFGLKNNTRSIDYLLYDNIKSYSIDNFTIQSSTPEQFEYKVPLRSDIAITMTNDIDTQTLGTVVIEANGVAVPAGEYDISANGAVFSIKFNGDLKPSTDYCVYLDNLKDIYGQPVGSAGYFTFTSDEVPGVQIVDANFYKIIGENFTQSDSLVSGEGLQSVAVTVRNNTVEVKDATIILAVYKANGQLIDCRYLYKKLNPNAMEEIGNGCIISDAVGGKVKIFSFNQMLNLVPWEKNIATIIE